MDAENRNAFIIDAIAYWQQILRLAQWKIKVITGAHLHPKEKWGEMKIIGAVFRAEMHISTLCPEEDVEEVVIHELLHLLTYKQRQFFFNNLVQLTRPLEGKIIRDEVTDKDEEVLGTLTLSFLEMKNRIHASREIKERLLNRNEKEQEK